MDDLDRFWGKVVAGENECQVWVGAKCRGYGHFRLGDQTVRAHRWIYEQLIRDLGDLHLHHLCRNRSCVNVAHLVPMTQAENNRQAPTTYRPRLFCNSGTHPKSGRRCSECRAEKNRRRRERRAIQK